MAVKFDLNLGRISEKVKNEVKQAMDDSLRVMHVRIDELSPQDTNKYINNHQEYKAREIWDKIIASIWNDTPYAEKLEFGEWRLYTYRKGKRGGSRRIIFGPTATGARVYTRTYDATEDVVKQLISNAVTKWLSNLGK